MGATWYIARTVTQSWRREIARIFGVHPRWVSLLAIVVAAATLTFAAILGQLLLSTGLGELPAQLRQGALFRVITWAFVSSGLTMLIFNMLAPDNTTIGTLVELLPVSRMNSFVGLFAPLAFVAFTFGAILATPAFVMVVELAGEPGTKIAVVALIAWLLIVVQALVLAAFHLLLRAFRRWLRLALHTALSGAALIVGCVILLPVPLHMFSRDPLPSSLSLPEMVWPDRFASIVMHAMIDGQGLPLPSLGVMAGWLAIAACGFWAMANTLRTEYVPPSVRLGVGIPVPKGRFPAQVWFETMVPIRTPQFVVTTLIVLVTAGALAIFGKNGNEVRYLAEQAGQALVASVFLLAMQSVGLTLACHWIFRHLLVQPASWVWPKATAMLMVSILSATVLTGILLGSDILPAAALATVAGTSVYVFSAALTGGTLMPYSPEQTLSIGITGITVGVLAFGTLRAAQWLLDGLGQSHFAPFIAAAALLTAYRMLAPRLEGVEMRGR